MASITASQVEWGGEDPLPCTDNRTSPLLHQVWMHMTIICSGLLKIDTPVLTNVRMLEAKTVLYGG